jgi:hypothetical protein
MKARKFAPDEIRPLSFQRDQIPLVFVHSRTSNSTSKLQIAEALSRYERP